MKEKLKLKKILLSGGGTMGSVSPLLAMAQALREKGNFDYDFLFLGTKRGLEKEVVGQENIPFHGILAGKWRRYFSWYNFLDPLKMFCGFWQSIYWLIRFRPNLILSAGGFVSVPLALAGRIFRIPLIIHQQDIRPGLANKIMAPGAKVITTVFEKSMTDYGSKAIWLGQPQMEYELPSQEEVLKKYGLTGEKPLILFLGGSTGAQGINDLIYDSLDDLLIFAQVFHIVGSDREPRAEEFDGEDGYVALPFVAHEELLGIMAASDLVVTRCGLGALSEVVALKKASILIPMPRSHQEDNAAIFALANAAIVWEQDILSAENFAEKIKDVWNNEDKRKQIAGNISAVIKPGANSAIVKIIEDVIK